MARRTKAEILAIEQAAMEWYEQTDAAARKIAQEWICELMEANDPQLERKIFLIKDACRRLSVHHMELFDDELAAMIAKRGEAHDH